MRAEDGSALEDKDRKVKKSKKRNSVYTPHDGTPISRLRSKVSGFYSDFIFKHEEKHEVKAVVFDIGGVVAVPAHSMFYRLFLRGMDSILSRYYDEDMAVRKFIRTYKGSKAIDLDMIDLVKDLKKAGYRVPVLSNVTEGKIDIYSDMGMYDEFHPLVLSGREGVRKPEPEIYEIAINRIGVRAEECVFVDDKKRNVKAAKKLGWKGIHYRGDPDKLRKQLRRLGVRLDG